MQRAAWFVVLGYSSLLTAKIVPLGVFHLWGPFFGGVGRILFEKGDYVSQRVGGGHFFLPSEHSSSPEGLGDRVWGNYVILIMSYYTMSTHTIPYFSMNA